MNEGPQNSSSLEQFGYKQQLSRVLGFKDLVIYGMLFMVIIAPNSIYGYISQASHGLTPLVYLIAAIAMFFTALSYKYFSERFPMAGSVYSYVQRGINPHVGFVAGWMILMDYIFIPSLLYLFTAQWCVDLFHWGPVWFWVVLFVAINTIINILGISMTAMMDNIIFVIEIILLVAFLVIGCMYLVNGGAQGFTIAPLYKPGVINLAFIGSACTIACLSFLGFDGISTLAEETKNPEKTVGKATIVTLVLIAIIFMAQTYIATLIQPDYAALNPATAFFDAAKQIGGEAFRIAFLLVNIIAVGLANTMTAQAATSRVLFGMARDKYLPGFFSTIHSKFKTPHLSIIFVAVLSIICSVSCKDTLLVSLVNFGAISSFVMLNIAVFVFFFVKEENRGIMPILKYVVSPLLGIIILGYVWLSFDSFTQKVGFSWAAIGIIYGFIKSKGYKIIPDAFKDGI